MRVVRDRTGRPDAETAGVRDAVREILALTERGHEGEILELVRRLDGLDVSSLRDLEVGAERCQAALQALDPELREALEVAVTNVRALVEAQLREPTDVRLAQGQRIEVTEMPMGRAGIYAPGGRGAYPSTVVMCAITARAAGVDHVTVCSPPGPDGWPHPVVLAACALCEVDAVYRVGGAQAIGLMASRRQPVMPQMDVVVGPGNAYVTEAKRQVVGQVGIDGLAGPSELIVVASDGADPELAALDLLAQAEHGPDSFLAVIADHDDLLEAILDAVRRLERDRPSVQDCQLYASTAAPGDAIWVAEKMAPEHLELVGAEAEALADRVRRAGCLFVGSQAATAFGDYVAGSNHVLPTGGAARFQSALSASTFRRRMARVSFPGDSAAKLAPAGAAIARAEGFPVHAESMERRA